MDRNIVYPGAIPLDSDLLWINRYGMVAIGQLIAAALGTAPQVVGLALAPTGPASFSFQVGPGTITGVSVVDANPYGSITVESDVLMKQGIQLDTKTLGPLTPPASSGLSQVFLVEAQMQEIDGSPLTLAYYNAANPASPYLGPGNSGAAQNSVRAQKVVLQIKNGTQATTGTQVAPAVDSGWTAIGTVVLTHGGTSITSANINQAAFAAPGLISNLGNVLNALSNPADSSAAIVTSAWLNQWAASGAGNARQALPLYTSVALPNGAWTYTTLKAGVFKVTMQGAGGPGGGGTTGQGGGGGGEGGVGVQWVTCALGDVLSGNVGVGQTGGTTGFGGATPGAPQSTTLKLNGTTLATATGGGGGGQLGTSAPGGVGGTFTGTIATGQACVGRGGQAGGDALAGASTNAGNGGGEGGGRGSSGGGAPAVGVGPGAGGGGSYGTATTGGTSANGQVVIEG